MADENHTSEMTKKASDVIARIDNRDTYYNMYSCNESSEFWKILVEKARNLPYDKAQQIYNLAASKDSQSIRHIPHPSNDAVSSAVAKNGFAIRYVQQTPELCSMAISNTSWALEFIIDQTPELCIAAITRCSETIKFVRNLTLEICEAAIVHNRNCLWHISNPSEEICMLAVGMYGTYLRKVIPPMRQTIDMCMIAVKQNGLALQYANAYHPDMCKLAIAQNKDAVDYVEGYKKRVRTQGKIHNGIEDPYCCTMM
jgi:hypothetical protein